MLIADTVTDALTVKSKIGGEVSVMAAQGIVALELLDGHHCADVFLNIAETEKLIANLNTQLAEARRLAEPKSTRDRFGAPAW